MFERFRKTRRTEDGAGAVSVRERQDERARARDVEDSSTRPGADASGGARFTRTPGERDRGISVEESRSTSRDASAESDTTIGRDDAREDVRMATSDQVTDADRTPADRRRADDDRINDPDRGGDGVDDRRAHSRDRAAAADGPRREAPVLDTDAMHTMRDRQRDRFGGIHWGADFFGWLSAIGLASILTAILVGAGVALGFSASDAADAQTAETIGLGGGIALLAVLAIAWFCGGYVAGRMARFDGAKQGLGVWLWTILAVLVVAALAAIGGSEYDVFQRLSLPRIAIGEDTMTAGGAITGAAALLVTLLFAVLGGKVGERFHRRVDRVATDEFVVDR